MPRRRRFLRSVSTSAVALSIPAIVGWAAPPADAQWNTNQGVFDRCQQELEYRMAREINSRQPNVYLDERRAQVRNSNSETRITGNGRYTRDDNDRPRDFSFDCTVSNRNGSTRASYRWSGPGYGGGQYPDPGYDYGRGGSTYPPNGRVYFSGGIVSRNSGKCLDVERRSNRDAANVQQWSCGGGSNQLWDIIDLGRGQYSIVSQGSNKVLDVAGGGNRDGANVQQYRWSGGDNQRWRLERVGNGAFQIVNMGSGKCLDVVGAGRDDGANIQQWTCGGGANQAWQLKK